MYLSLSLRKLCLVLVVAYMVPSLSWADVHMVSSRDNSGANTLRQAISDATAGDTINFFITGDNSITAYSPLVIDKQLYIAGMLSQQVIGSTNGVDVLVIQAGAAGTELSNVAVINGNVGIHIQADNCKVYGCRIGVDYSDTAHPNGNGIEVNADHITIGGTLPSDRNIISGNTNAGILISDASDTQIENNYIGLNYAGSAAIANYDGIYLTTNATDNLIGGNYHSSQSNYISGNSHIGIYFYAASATGNSIAGNVIGLGSNNTTKIANTYAGISVYSAQNNFIGIASEGCGNTISGSTYGILADVDAPGNIVRNNAIVDNTTNGIRLQTSRWLVGGYQNAAYYHRNLISGNGTDVYVAGNSNTICGNIIGTNWAGTTSSGAHDGIRINGSSNLIGGANSDVNHILGNLISGHTNQDGIDLFGAGNGNTVVGNTIGLNLAGTAALGNQIGIRIASNANCIGGTSSTLRNVISGNSSQGIYITSRNQVISGNYIGLNAAGTAVIENTTYGINLGLSTATGNLIGGTSAGAGNYICGADYGISLLSDATGNTLVGNILNLLPNGTLSTEKFQTGIWVNATGNNACNNWIGLPGGAGNLITNSVDGIQIDASTQNRIFGNTITACTGLGINLSASGNTNKSAPTITSAHTNIVYGTAVANDTIELFRAEPGGPNGGSLSRMGSTTADSTGHWIVDFGTPTLTLGESVCATGTDTLGNTSQFSNDAIVGTPPTVTATPTRTPTLTRTRTATPTPTRTRTSTASATLTATQTITVTSTRTPTPTITLTDTPTSDNILAGVDLKGRVVLAYPNPAKDTVQFLMHLETAAKVEILGYNLAGEQVMHLAEDRPAGRGQYLVWNCSQAAPGIYLVRVLLDGREKAKLKIAVTR